MDLDELERAIKKHSVKACVIMPNCHNPLGYVLPNSHKQALVELTARRNVAVIEDDLYGDQMCIRDSDRATPVPAQRWSKLQTAQLVVQFLPVAFLLQVGLAMFSRQRIDAQSAQVADAVAKSLPELRDEVRQQLRDAYSSVKTQLVAEWTRQHEKELEARLEDLKQAVQLRESGGQRVADAQTKLTEVREIVDAQKTFLDQFRPKVWSGIDAGGFPA